MTPIAQIATPTNLDLVILIQIIKSIFDLLARHADRIIGSVVAGEHRGAAVVGKGREEIVDDGVVARGEDVGGVGCVEVGVVVLAVGYLAGCAADGGAEGGAFVVGGGLGGGWGGGGCAWWGWWGWWG